MSQRLIYILSLVLIVGSLAFGFYLEYFDGIMPCPLCTLQRISFGSIGILFFIGIFIHRYKLGRLFINFFALLFSGAGAALAARQIWIQYHPSSAGGECGVSLHYMLQVLPLHEVMDRVFTGSAECSERGWHMLGLNIPEWSLVFFIAFALICLFYIIKDIRGTDS